MTKDWMIMKQKYNIIFLAVLSAVVSCVQVDEAVLPHRHGDKVHPVPLGVAGGLAVIRAKDFYTELAVQKSPDYKDC